jgi:hypothetical protein
MSPKPDDKTPKDGQRALGDAEISSQRISRRWLLATLGIAAGVAASVALGGHAGAGENPQPGLLAKIQIATAYATTNRTTILSRVQRKPSLNRARFRTLP